MYVTDTPVMDRITDPAVREIDAASENLETALYDLQGWLEELPREDGAFAPAEIQEGLSEAHNRALSAFGHVMDALDLANLPTL